METPILRTLHPNPAASDLATLEQQLHWITDRIQQLERDRDIYLENDHAIRLRFLEPEVVALRKQNTSLTDQIQQLLQANAALAERVQQLETAVLALPKQPSSQEAAAPQPTKRAADSSPQRRRPVLASFDQKSGVFGNHRLERSQITSVTVLSTLSDAPKGAWDISLQKDGSALAWVKKIGGSYALFLAGEGGITAPPDSSYLFSNYSSLTSLDFGRSFFTGRVTDMSWMFSSCSKLTVLDLSCFNTANVTDMSWMFADCHILASLDLSGFRTEQVRNMSRMFTDCYVLSSIQISSFRTDSAADLRYMFTNCSGLTPKARTALRDRGFPV